MGQSLRAGAQIFLSFVFINPTFCAGSGVRLFQGMFCAYATVINEATGALLCLVCTERISSFKKI